MVSILPFFCRPPLLSSTIILHGSVNLGKKKVGEGDDTLTHKGEIGTLHSNQASFDYDQNDNSVNLPLTNISEPIMDGTG